MAHHLMGPRPAATPATRIVPGPGQESVWDFPRPPRVEPGTEHVVIRFGGQVVADTRDAVRVLETSHPPGYYLPRAAFAEGVLVEAPGSSVCEFKGIGQYLDLRVGDETAVARDDVVKGVGSALRHPVERRIDIAEARLRQRLRGGQ